MKKHFKKTISVEPMSAAQFHRKKLCDYLDKNGKFRTPLWMVPYLAYMGLEPTAEGALDLEDVLNEVINDNEDVESYIIVNTIANIVLILNEMKKDLVVIL